MAKFFQGCHLHVVTGLPLCKSFVLTLFKGYAYPYTQLTQHYGKGFLLAIGAMELCCIEMV